MAKKITPQRLEKLLNGLPTEEERAAFVREFPKIFPKEKSLEVADYYRKKGQMVKQALALGGAGEKEEALKTYKKAYNIGELALRSYHFYDRIRSGEIRDIDDQELFLESLGGIYAAFNPDEKKFLETSLNLIITCEDDYENERKGEDAEVYLDFAGVPLFDSYDQPERGLFYLLSEKEEDEYIKNWYGAAISKEVKEKPGSIINFLERFPQTGKEKDKSQIEVEGRFKTARRMSKKLGYESWEGNGEIQKFLEDFEAFSLSLDCLPEYKRFAALWRGDFINGRCWGLMDQIEMNMEEEQNEDSRKELEILWKQYKPICKLLGVKSL
ncbi:MAG: hypothetical protein KKA64_00680 [Nanoarchaeota archaeon]|nr:hypothetical protein [Nanoarchaeota archaeon]